MWFFPNRFLCTYMSHWLFFLFPYPVFFASQRQVFRWVTLLECPTRHIFFFNWEVFLIGAQFFNQLKLQAVLCIQFFSPFCCYLSLNSHSYGFDKGVQMWKRTNIKTNSFKKCVILWPHQADWWFNVWQTTLRSKRYISGLTGQR